MAQVFGQTLWVQLLAERESIKANQEERQQRIADGLTDYEDCFISMRTEEQRLLAISMEMEILQGDGLMDVDIIIDPNSGEDVGARWVDTKYGRRFVGRGVFASSEAALISKTGWKYKSIKVPVWVKFVGGSGGGMCAVYTGGYQFVRWHTNMVTGEYVGF